MAIDGQIGGGGSSCFISHTALSRLWQQIVWVVRIHAAGRDRGMNGLEYRSKTDATRYCLFIRVMIMKDRRSK